MWSPKRPEAPDGRRQTTRPRCKLCQCGHDGQPANRKLIEMLAYIARRLLLMIPTIFGIMLVSFAIVQFVPGGPVERAIAQLQGADQGSTASFGGGGGQIGAGAAQAGGDISSRYRGAQGLDPKFIKELEKQYGFDKPALGAVLDPGRAITRPSISASSYYRDAPVLQLIKEKLPVSISLGLWMTFISYAISIPLGIRKAVKDGSRFDTATSAVVIFGYAIPSFLFAILLIVLFCGGSFWQIFPAARPDLGQFRRPRLAAQDPRLPLAHHAAGRPRWCSAPSRPRPC